MGRFRKHLSWKPIYRYGRIAQWLSISLGLLTALVAIAHLNSENINPEGERSRGGQTIITTPIFTFTPLDHPRIPKPNEISGSGLSDINFAQIDFDGKHIPYNDTSVTRLANLLSRRATTDAEKARIAYAWITHNIRYDVQAFLDKTYTLVSAEDVLKTRQAVCSGYAVLYEALTRAMGLETVIIIGHAKGSEYGLEDTNDANHAWNATKINDSWYLVDPTWGAGTINGAAFNPEFNPFYFAPDPSHMVYSHFPEVAEWQLLAQPIQKEAFEQAPMLSSRFFNQGLELISPSTYLIDAPQANHIVLKVPEETDIIASYHLGPWDYTSANANFETMQIWRSGVDVRIPLTEKGQDYEVILFTRPAQTSGHYTSAAMFRVQSPQSI